MDRSRRETLRLFGAGASVLLALSGVRPALAATAARELKWEELIPFDLDKMIAQASPSGIVQHGQLSRPQRGALPLDEGVPDPVTGGSSLKALQPAGSEVVAELNGTRVRMRGFVVPLGFDGSKVRAFLLVPYVGACIHVPPPPANQIVFIEAPKPFEIANMFEAVAVTGTLRTQAMTNDIASFGYQLAAEQIERISTR